MVYSVSYMHMHRWHSTTELAISLFPDKKHKQYFQLFFCMKEFPGFVAFSELPLNLQMFLVKQGDKHYIH